MDERRPTLEELDAMTPAERAAVFEAGIITDWDDVPEHIQEVVTATAARLSIERGERRNSAGA